MMHIYVQKMYNDTLFAMANIWKQAQYSNSRNG